MYTARGRLKVAFERSFPRVYSSARYARRKSILRALAELDQQHDRASATKSHDMNDFVKCQNTPRFTLSGYSLTIA